MNYPMNVHINNHHSTVRIFNYREASLIAKMVRAIGVRKTSSLDIRCQKTGGYMGRVCMESFNVYNARDELVFPTENNNGTEPLSNIEIKPINY